MSDIKLDIRASELTYQAFTEDLGEILNNNVMYGVANRIIGEMKDTLEYRIQEDVYKEYQPDIYPRRSENDGFGIPLIDMEHNVIVSPTSSSEVGKGGVRITFNYMPSGAHSGVFGDITTDPRVLGRWGKDADDPIKPSEAQADGNKLIRRIETGEGYDWLPNKKKKKKFTDERPFWRNFVEEMIEGGGFASAAKMAFKYEGLPLEGEVVVERESGDGNY